MPSYDDAHDEPRATPAAGTVTALEPQKKNANRLSVFIDGVFSFGIEQDVLLDHPIARGSELGEEAIRRILEDDARLRARRFTIAYLARRARTEHEVRDALRQRDFAGEVVDHAIERLKNLNYLDDADYARRYVDSRVKAKGYGPMRLRRELQRRGVAAALIEAAIAPLEASNELEEQALAQARGRLNRLRREPDERKRRKKLSDFLLRRGFDFDTISPVVETVLREARVG